MNLHDIFSLYSDTPPLDWESKETSRGTDDYRQAVFVRWDDLHLVIKITRNDFTAPDRVRIWRKTAEAYRALGYYCPEIILNKNGNAAEFVDFEGKKCVVYAEEFSRYKTAGSFGENAIRRDDNRYIFHDDALRFLCDIGLKRLDFAEFPSGLCIFEKFCPSDAHDEIMDCALDFKDIIENQFPQFHERFQQIWRDFIVNRDKLVEIYPKLPVSVFQADLNTDNILLAEMDENLRFAGVLDFNLCGRDTVLNVLFREFLINFDEDIPDKSLNNMYYEPENSDYALQSFLHNIQKAKQFYPFSAAEILAAPMLYRYIRPFWWRPLNALRRDRNCPEKVGLILDWIQREQNRNIDFCTIMGGF